MQACPCSKKYLALDLTAQIAAERRKRIRWCQNRGDPCMGLRLSRRLGNATHVFSSVSLFDLKARFFIPTRSSAKPSRRSCQGWPSHNCNALNLGSYFLCFHTPAIEQIQHCALVDRELLQRLALDARHYAGNEPARLAHLDHGDQRAVRIEASEGSEERRVGKECRSRWSPYH